MPLETWSLENVDEHTKKRCTARFKRHKRTYLKWSLELKNCKDRALFTTWSSDGQREHQQPRKVLLLHFSQLGPVRSVRWGFSHHPVGSVPLSYWRFLFYLPLSSSSSPLSGLHTHYVAEVEPVCVFQMAVKRPHPPTIRSTPLWPQRGQPERKTAGPNFQNKTPLVRTCPLSRFLATAKVYMK